MFLLLLVHLASRICGFSFHQLWEIISHYFFKYFPVPPLPSRIPTTYTCVHAQSLQSYLILCNPTDSCSSVHVILQARILEWIAKPSSKGCSQIRDQTCTPCVSCIDKQVLNQLSHQGSPWATRDCPTALWCSVYLLKSFFPCFILSCLLLHLQICHSFILQSLIY